ncbi:FtsX-like permease family protein [Thauera aromatica]|uniref:Putative ABC lipid transporter, LolCE n=1 Tax=Thauera aromatica K172 TaxID=44139 RepID=A0A2R4BNM2_THAAR|nr:FtsX-like permease family protein [Thauera aromatica]AVR88931.1 putative ABC lipid transporter, LolCE [Thauera aromatica K172]
MTSRAGLRHVFLASLLRRRLATALSLFAIALGVALGLAVQLIHGAALDEFGRGVRLLAGAADLQLVGPREGFDEAIYPVLALRAEIAAASPVLEIEARLPGRSDSLRILGIDLFRLARVQPALLPLANESGNHLAALQPDALFVTDEARAQLSQALRAADGTLQPPAIDGATLLAQSGLESLRLRLAGSLPGASGVLGVMDLAGAQQHFERIGVLSRIDLKLADGITPQVATAALAPLLPPGLALRRPEAAAGEAGTLTRAYRVNLTMLAAIALLTGGFLVFSTQLLSVARRRREFALLRALGLVRRQLVRGLLAEGAVVGLIGGMAGVIVGHALAALAFRLVGADLGAGFFSGLTPALHFDPVLSLGYLVLGVLAGMAGTWLPAREAARVPPAHALRAGEGERAGLMPVRVRARSAVALLALAALACLPPPVGGVPLGGYAAVALVLVAAVMALPALTRAVLPLLRRGQGVMWRLAHARLCTMPGQAVVAGAGVVASVALAVSMAIMVSSFRVSVDEWLTQVLPADLYLRASSTGNSGYLDPQALARIAAIPGVARVDTTRLVNLRLSADEPLFSVLARPVGGNWGLPLVAGTLDAPAGGPPPVWVSEAAADRHGLQPGDTFELPLGGRLRRFAVAGIWRDYARQHGAALIDHRDYIALTGDTRVNDAALRVHPGTDPQAVAGTLRALFGSAYFTIALPGEIRALSLRIFDRTFLITYLMEAVAVLIGLFGIATTFAALATTRQGEFGMLRHLGLRRAEIGRLIAAEGALTAGLGVLAGLIAGGAIAWVLIEVINRQSFHWSMELAVPWAALAVFAVSLIGLAALVARLAGGHAMRRSAVLAVKADW